MALVRVMTEMVLLPFPQDQFIATIEMDHEPTVGEILEIETNSGLHRLEVVKLRYDNANSGTMFEIRETWAISRKLQKN